MKVFDKTRYYSQCPCEYYIGGRWPEDCHGKSAAEMLEMGYEPDPRWMVESKHQKFFAGVRAVSFVCLVALCFF